MFKLGEPKNCRDCDVAPNTQHDAGCDVARCISTGMQWIQCGGQEHVYKGRYYGEHQGPCEPDVWTGYYPGYEDCIRLGYWCKWTSNGFKPCDADDLEATPNVTRLMTSCNWNPELQRFEPRN
jgi:hypothetical protein